MRNSGLRYPRLGWVVLLTIVCFAIAPGAQAWSLYVSNQVSGIVAAYDSTSGAFQADVGRYSLPAGLTINGNDQYVSDLLANTIYSVPLSGGSQSTFITLPGNSGPFQVAFDALGNAYVATLVSGLVYKFDSSGIEIGSPVAVSRARGITYDPVDGNLYVVSTPNSDGFGGIDAIEQLSTSLMVLNPAFITSNMRQGGATAEPAINAPRFIAIDSVGNFSISNTGTDPT